MSLSDSDGDTVVVRSGDIRDFNSDNILPLPAKDLAEITKWLQPTPYDFERSEYSRHRASHLLGTGAWLTSTPVYQQWHSGDNGLLWIKGIPGSGKSVMAASIIKQLVHDMHVPVIYFFFRQIIEANHKPIVALRDWLCQILDYSPPLQVKLDQYVKDKRSLDDLSPMDLWDDLKMALSGLPSVYCVTDALDEMDLGNDDFLHGLVDLGRWRPKKIKVLMTSRPIARLETSLRSSMISIPQIRLEERMVDLDIGAYVQYRLRRSSIAKEHCSVIEEAIPGRANGMFLYAKMSMDAFLEPGADVQEVLKALPMDLNTMYNELLQEHSRRSNVPFELQQLILQFATHATRPLRLLEIAEMINTRNPDSNRTLKETKDLVRAACGPLLEILSDETVSVIHHSFTEFLKGYTRSKSSDSSEYPILEAGPINSQLASACLLYLRAGCLDRLEEVTNRTPGESNSRFNNGKQEKKREFRLQFPFLEYAANNWCTHAHRAETSGENMQNFHDDLDVFFAETDRYEAWLDFTCQNSKIEKLTSIRIAARTGLPQFAKHLLSKEDFMDKNCRELPISIAASNGHADVVQVLIDHGADPNTEGKEGLKPLHLAAKSNHVETVKVLLAAGVDPLTPKTKENKSQGAERRFHPRERKKTIGETPLMYACYAGHLETVAEFVPLLQNVEDLHNALHWAAEKARSNIVDLILQQPGIDVNVKLEGDTALFLACKMKEIKTIELLVRAGADANVRCGNPDLHHGYLSRTFFLKSTIFGKKSDSEPGSWGCTALHALCRGPGSGGYDCKHLAECVKLLLEAGVDVNAQAPGGSTALHYAIEWSVELIKPLLEAGADPTAEDDAGETPLHSSKSIKDEALSLLISSGKVDINKPRKKDGKTPLLCRIADCNFDNESIIKFLKYKPDINATDSKGHGVLHLVFMGPSRLIKCDMIDALLSAGADPNLKDEEGNTPLHVMSQNTEENIIKSLVLAGADLEAQNRKGESVLFRHLSSCRIIPGNNTSSMLDRLVSLGARLDTRNHRGQTLWHRAIENPEILSCLQSLDLDPLVSDYDGNTPLHALIANTSTRYPTRDKKNLLQRLIKIGMNINQRNHQGRTVLHTACSRDNSSKETYEPLDYILRVSESSAPIDHEGIQPLHIAATISEVFVHKLLNAGADIRARTHDKMTVLHLAAQARQSGIVDMIISQATSLEDESRLEFMNSQDADGRTALHYACRSGRPETVKSLIEAGVDVKILDTSKHSALAICAEYEKEALRWDLRMPLVIRGNRGLNAAGLTLRDETRPFLDRVHDDIKPTFGMINSEHDTTRLAEIIELLFKHGLDLESDIMSLRSAWEIAAQPEYGYTISCLPPKPTPLTLTYVIGGDKCIGDYRSILDDIDQDMRISLAMNSRKAMEETIEKSKPQDEDEKNKAQLKIHAASIQERPLGNALALRYYDLFERISKERSLLVNPDDKVSIPLNMLARWGFSELLSRVCTREMATKLDIVYLDPSPEKKSNPRTHKPLILSACERDLPNMETLKLIVENFGVNINAKCTERIYRDRGHSVEFTRGALHDLATGKLWWHVNKALPYLIQMGADMDIRNIEGQTPLFVSLNSNNPFSKEAAIILIKAGADVNAVSTNDIGCLQSAGNDPDMIRLLISHGAKANKKAVLSALDHGRVEILEALLSHGGNEIVSQLLPAELFYGIKSAYFKVVDGALPLLYAAIRGTLKTPSLSLDTIFSIRKRLLEVLLKDRACDPYATFSKQEFQPKDRDGSIIGEPKDFPVVTATVLHEILSANEVFEPFFNLPSLDLEYRDENDCTLLLAASKSLGRKSYSHKKPNSMNYFQELINRGANALAQDIEGKTFLHHVGPHTEKADLDMLQTTVKANPSLVNITDNANETALHHALRENCFALVEILLDHGANPLQPDKHGQTGLHRIARFEHEWKGELFQRFLQAGVDINSRNNKGETPPLPTHEYRKQLYMLLRRK
ncbi:uncharacterized protein N7483_012301 [Penicillium malachiteum]|uniref:uncharacterized protein n=1 Tax=Penicillium malachiteum TaxID=1324776 RepID=UPI0025481432|nr:uncharacterized protein N7483_012301 [Penicillium malachiteum]KAJ5715120.1 hypothetical protein N7483_012301 [Penicillium malachiteum]